MTFPTDLEGREAQPDELIRTAEDRARRQVLRWSRSPYCSGLYLYSDNGPGAYSFARRGYRRMGPMQHRTEIYGTTGAGLIGEGIDYDTRRDLLIAGYRSMSSEVTARLIGGANGGAELNELWRDDSLLGSGKGVLYAFMTASGRVVATVETTGSFSLSQLRGELVPIPTGLHSHDANGHR